MYFVQLVRCGRGSSYGFAPSIQHDSPDADTFIEEEQSSLIDPGAFSGNWEPTIDTLHVYPVTDNIGTP
ncbi:hypothetical protein BLNAU_17140 [Blattamonas nauphoetae]|uniref:Uncharacterized protein n=1 Tax=Blattamonas nauphoetae TaxID=2049346 RepID=A0ABQ9X9I7_9EUKA|nr:hypothetical protein BLNAU_17140 [Blattamonas nauphoetae]